MPLQEKEEEKEEETMLSAGAHTHSERSAQKRELPPSSLIPEGVPEEVLPEITPKIGAVFLERRNSRLSVIVNAGLSLTLPPSPPVLSLLSLSRSLSQLSLSKGRKKTTLFDMSLVLCQRFAGIDISRSSPLDLNLEIERSTSSKKSSAFVCFLPQIQRILW